MAWRYDGNKIVRSTRFIRCVFSQFRCLGLENNLKRNNDLSICINTGRNRRGVSSPVGH